MKKYILLVLLAATAGAASAQASGASAGSPAKEDIGTTVYGLPVLKSYVEPDVVERAKKKYGRVLYSIEKSTAANCQSSYLVGLIRNGKLTVDWMCDDPKIAQNSNRIKFLNGKKTEKAGSLFF